LIPLTPFTAVVLAAGLGKRMKSDLPKVLHPALGKPLILHVLAQLHPLHPTRVVVVVGHKEELVREALGGKDVHYVTQSPQLGTGHAVQTAWPEVERGAERGAETLLVLAGDMPLVRTMTLRRLVEKHQADRSAVTFLSGELDDPAGYGRVVRDRRGDFVKIVEEKDATAAERKIAEVNSGVYCFQLKPLEEALGLLRADNTQKEYYLTDTLAILKDRGLRVGIVQASDSRELFGVNTPEQLAMVEQTLRAWGEG
jgi:bifunctional UDP-N-acetylglucosamine pyrophosphorylase / glucosamine-1-phosphate N-acetyltransferase